MQITKKVVRISKNADKKMIPQRKSCSTGTAKMKLVLDHHQSLKTLSLSKI